MRNNEEPANRGAVMSAEVGDPDRDLTWRIADLRLPTPEQLLTVEAHERLGHVIGLMVENEYSQLPVVAQHRRLVGIITWESIAQANFRAERPRTVADAMLRNPRTARPGEPVFPHIDGIYRYGFLVIVDGTYSATSILTAADLAVELRKRVEPFTLVEEIERRLRRAVSVLPVEDLRACFRKDDPRAKSLMSCEELNLGNYSHLIDDDKRWEKLGWPYDRADIVAHLKEVADYRNILMHWDNAAPGAESQKLALAKRVLRLLKALDTN